MPHRPVATLTPLLLAYAAAAGAQQSRATGPLGAHPVADVPAVTVTYAPLLDGACADMSGRPLDTARVALVRRREASYAALWAARGPALLAAAREATGAPFPARELHAALSTCWPGSMSFPLIIGVGVARHARADSATADALFVGTLFHEILHGYINAVRGEPSPEATALLRKHGAESQRVRNHVHLLALQQRVYERLGLDAEFRLVASSTRASDPEVLGRAHDIVDAEGAEAFVRELAALARARGARR